jgi:saccharopepsin
MIEQNLIDEPLFAFRLGSSEEDGGEATFGGIDHDAYTGKLKYVPLRRKAYWEVELNKVAFGNDELELDNTGAAIDTGEFCILDKMIEQQGANTFRRHFTYCSSIRYG